MKTIVLLKGISFQQCQNEKILGVYYNLSYATKELMNFKQTGDWLDLRCETWQVQEDNVPAA